MFWLVCLRSGCEAPDPSAASRSEPVAEAEPGLPDQILVVVNGLRAGPDGWDPVARAVGTHVPGVPHTIFERAYSQSTHPLLGLGSILTGRYVAAIPMCSRPDQSGAEATEWCAKIPESVATLPEVLALYGYRTLLATNSRRLKEALGENFRRTVAPQLEPEAVVPARTTWSEDLREGVTRWWTRNQDHPRLAVLVWTINGESIRVHAKKRFQDVPQEQAYRSSYELVVDATVADVGRMLENLLQEPAPRPWSVMLTSSHGVSLGELGGLPEEQAWRVTTEQLTDRTIRVPLYVYGPEPVEQPTRVNGIVQLLDVMPTMLARAGATPPADIVGKDLALQLSVPAGSGYAYAEWGDMMALRKDSYFLLSRTFNHGGTTLDPALTQSLVDGRDQFALYDVEQDPWQLRDLKGDHPDQTLALRSFLLGVRTGPAAPRVDPQIWNSEAMQQVRSRGYW